MSEDIIGQIISEGDTAVVTFRKKSISDVEDITTAALSIAGFIETCHPRRIVFDFKNVKFFSSQVLGLLLETRAAMAPCDGQVLISSINPQLHRVFKITNLDQVFSFFPDTESAINAPRSDSSVKSG